MKYMWFESSLKKNPTREIDQKKSAVEKSSGKSGTLTLLVLIGMVGHFFWRRREQNLISSAFS